MISEISSRTSTIRIGSRGSQLALWQANHVAAQLRALGHNVEIEVIRTTGDRMQNPAFAAGAGPKAAGPDRLSAEGASEASGGLSPNGTGIFIKEIEDALAAGRIDLAVHSLKDLPTEIDPRFTLAAIPVRADARDAFVCEEFWGLHMLPAGARIGTTSPRRQAMIHALRPDVRFVEMRGNIDSRLRKYSEGHADALVLASAGLDRLGRTENVHQRFSVDELCPAPGQGALALETRTPLHPSALSNPVEDAGIHDAVRVLNDAAAEFAVTAERAVLADLGGGCQLPLGAYCHASEEQWHLHAMVGSPDGEQVAHVIHCAPFGVPAGELGAAAAEALTARGALQLLSGDALSDSLL
jgi:hydroxymethylbilane synthase